jgi:hypothetical protein
MLLSDRLVSRLFFIFNCPCRVAFASAPISVKLSFVPGTAESFMIPPECPAKRKHIVDELMNITPWSTVGFLGNK